MKKLACTALSLATHYGVADTTVDPIQSTAQLLPLSWEELTQLEVTTLARQEQSVQNSPSAAFVITAEDIRRSGATSLPELLRMVPGMNVAKVNSWNWAVSARGLSDLYANKLQVMIDGRSIYDPLNGGVYWGQQHPFLPDIERIEIMRGPSGSLWGANAVNGTINIVTRSARDTQGGLVYAGGGSEEQGFGGIRYGAKLSESTYLRASGHALSRDASTDITGRHATRDNSAARYGSFRLDSQVSPQDRFMLEGSVTHYQDNGYYIGVTSLTSPYWRQDDTGLNGITGSLQGNWSHRTDAGHNWRLNTTFTQTDWNLAVGEMNRSSYALDFQHTLPSLANHSLLWGVFYQGIDDHFKNSLTLGFHPNEFTQNNVGLLLQDQIDLLPNQLKLTLSTRVENFTYTGWETEPNIRLLWTPNQQHSLWAGISRAVVLPSRAQHSIDLLLPITSLPNGAPLFMHGQGNPDMRTENLLAYEWGWRWQATPAVSVDTALFYNVYDRIQAAQFVGSPHFDPGYGAFVLNGQTGNFRKVSSYGLEWSLNYRLTNDWRLQASYTGMRIDVNANPDSPWFSNPFEPEKNTPNHTLSLRSLFNLTEAIELDAWIRYVDQISIGQQRIPDYLSLDLRLGWHPHKNLELSLVGQNLLDGQHPEFRDDVFVPVASQIQRAYLARAEWRF